MMKHKPFFIPRIFTASGLLSYKLEDGYEKFSVEEIVIVQNDVCIENGGVSLKYLVSPDDYEYSDRVKPAVSVSASYTSSGTYPLLLGTGKKLDRVIVEDGNHLLVEVEVPAIAGAECKIVVCGEKVRK